MLSPQEPASVACSYKQGELFYSVGKCISQLTAVKVERGFGEKKKRKKNEGEWSGKGENIRTREKILAVDGACVPIVQPTPRFKRKTVSSGFSIEGTVMSASAIPN